MDIDEFRRFGKYAVDYVANYLENIRKRNVLPDVCPGDVMKQLQEEMPENPDHWQSVMSDLDSIIVPGLTHWQSPYFHAYYPASNSYGSIVGELLSSGLNVLGFSWVTMFILILYILLFNIHCVRRYLSSPRGL